MVIGNILGAKYHVNSSSQPDSHPSSESAEAISTPAAGMSQILPDADTANGRIVVRQGDPVPSNIEHHIQKLQMILRDMTIQM